MANQLQATVYQIDGSPLDAPASISFLTSDIMIKEATIPNFASVNAAIFYYPNTNNKLQDQVFYVSETLASLITAANTGSVTQVQATVIAINQDPQVPAGVQYTFPANNIAIRENIDVAAGINADIQYKNKVYSVAETESSLVTDSNYITPVSLGGLFAQTANSTPITGTTVESTLINGGVGSLSVPANGFSVGDSFRGDFGGVLSTANNQTIRIRIKSGSAIFVDSGLQTINNVSNNVWSLSIDFTVRQLGAAGAASIVTLATFNYAKTVNGTVEGFSFNSVNNTTFDTTINNTLDVTVQWGSANAGNSIYSDIFILNKIY
jgi:hypothetical protein